MSKWHLRRHEEQSRGETLCSRAYGGPRDQTLVCATPAEFFDQTTSDRCTRCDQQARRDQEDKQVRQAVIEKYGSERFARPSATPTLLERIGRELYGNEWMTRLARALHVRTVRRWASGEQPIPEDVWEKLDRLIVARSNEINALREELPTRHTKWRIAFDMLGLMNEMRRGQREDDE